MSISERRCHLTMKDYTILEVMLARDKGHSEAITDLLRRKLATAKVVFQDEISPRVATINSRIDYRIDGGQVESRVLSHGEVEPAPGITLPVSTLRGLALLGQAEGEPITVHRSDGETEVLTIERVAYQPESARKQTAHLGRCAPGEQSAFRLTHLTDRLPHRDASAHRGSGGDDPGPSAA